MWPSQSTHTYREDEESLLDSFSSISTRPPSPISDGAEYSNFPYLTTWKQVQGTAASSLWQMVLFTIPSFLRRTPGPASSTEKQLPLDGSKKYSTEYLDGVRGVASFIVFMFHWTHLFYPKTNTGYRIGRHSSIWQLPIIKIVYSGSAMVAVFFVVSGYVLTHRFILKMYRHDYGNFYPALTSITFRRALRLFLPSLASCLLAYVCTSIGLVTIPNSKKRLKFEHGLGALLTYLDKEFAPWTWDSYMDGFYNPQLWSISLEYRGSMVVFLVVLGLAKTRTSIRLLVELAMIIHAFSHYRWDVALFMAGMMIAEMDVFVHDSKIRTALMQTRRAKAILFTIMFMGMWLSGFPRDHPHSAWGYGFLNAMWPYTLYRRRFWLGLSAIMLVAPMPYMPGLQAFFNSKPIKYLGKISFSIYLIHGLTNRTIGVWLTRIIWGIIGVKGYWHYMFSYIICTGLYAPIVIWWSDVFWRAVDIPSTHFAKWIEGKCASRGST